MSSVLRQWQLPITPAKTAIVFFVAFFSLYLQEKYRKQVNKIFRIDFFFFSRHTLDKSVIKTIRKIYLYL